MSNDSFHKRIRQSIADEDLQIALDGNAQRRSGFPPGRLSHRLPDWQERRKRAHAVKEDVISQPG